MSKSTSFDDCQKYPRNRPRTPKQCPIAHQNVQILSNRRVLMTARNGQAIVPGHQNSVIYSTRKKPEMIKPTSFDDFQKWPRNRPRTSKQCEHTKKPEMI